MLDDVRSEFDDPCGAVALALEGRSEFCLDVEKRLLIGAPQSLDERPYVGRCRGEDGLQLRPPDRQFLGGTEGGARLHGVDGRHSVRVWSITRAVAIQSW